MKKSINDLRPELFLRGVLRQVTQVTRLDGRSVEELGGQERFCRGGRASAVKEEIVLKKTRMSEKRH